LILVIVGSQHFQFNRLLREMDNLVEQGVIKGEVFAQTGHSDYNPRNYAYVDFLDTTDYMQKIRDSDLIVCHGGVGAIIPALKENKKIIAIPRLEKFNEHIDDHQMEIIGYFSKKNLLYRIDSVESLGNAVAEVGLSRFSKMEFQNEKMLDLVGSELKISNVGQKKGFLRVLKCLFFG